MQTTEIAGGINSTCENSQSRDSFQRHPEDFPIPSTKVARQDEKGRHSSKMKFFKEKNIIFKDIEHLKKAFLNDLAEFASR